MPQLQRHTLCIIVAALAAASAAASQGSVQPWLPVATGGEYCTLGKYLGGNLGRIAWRMKF